MSDGGLLVAVAEMALAGDRGVALQTDTTLPLAAFLFGEDQGRYVVATDQPDAVVAASVKSGVPAQPIGQTTAGIGTDATLTLNNSDPISLSSLRRAHENWLPNYMAGDPSASEPSG
jgi:phosphoribosylformylglycinamidine synthase